MAFHIQYVGKKKQDKKRAKTLQKGGFSQVSQPLAQNSWKEGSLVSGIPKIRDPSNQEFLKQGIARKDGQQMAPLIAVWKVIMNIWHTRQALKILLCNLEFMNPNFTRLCFDNSLIFHAKTGKVPSFKEFLIWGIPHFGNSWNEGSLILGILDLRDPLF